MVKSAVEEDFFLNDHKDFVLKEQVIIRMAEHQDFTIMV